MLEILAIIILLPIAALTAFFTVTIGAAFITSAFKRKKKQ